MTEKVHVQARFDAGWRFSVESGSGHAVTLHGDHQAGYSPMELVLASLAGCSGISVISIVLKKQQVVTNYKVRIPSYLRISPSSTSSRAITYVPQQLNGQLSWPKHAIAL